MIEILPHTRKSNSAQKHSLLFDGRFAVGALIGILLSICLYLLTDILSVSLTRGEILQIVPTLLALLVATISLLISYHAFSEQRRMRQAGTDPVILVHLGGRSDTPMMIVFEISNVGAGAAMNIELEIDPKVASFDASRVVTDLSELTHPIRVIPQNRSVQFNFGIGHQLLADPPLPPFEVTVKYQDIEGAGYASTQILDVRELSKRPAHTPPLAKISASLEKLERNFSQSVSGYRSIHVRTQTKREFIEEQAEKFAAIRAKQEEE